ncbi:response regulator [Halapricum sp. CBA1109]|uniref:response regulator transcription factor n=1 Tax=Halapricum sp. CBA1109 TaxID=2668068 RepID=UPI0012FC3984|nr:response regulator [Halapricum sp. CBA1109]MUV89941.1 response regulator [Halapricum sp. CBA1109]
MDSDASVLVVDDEKEVADVYALRLRDQYDTDTAYGGEAALEAVDEDTDVMLLDRRMPDVSGDDVLERIRERGLDCRVIMITAVDPDFEIIDMPFDDYLCKPVEKADLESAIEQQLAASRYDDRLSEYMNVTSKLALLEEEKPPTTMEENEDVEQLRQRAERLRTELDEALEQFDDIDSAFLEIGRTPG